MMPLSRLARSRCHAPVLLLYILLIAMSVYCADGSDDWMDHRHAEALIPRLSVPSKLRIVENAGHQLFLEQPERFNQYLREDIEELRRQTHH